LSNPRNRRKAKASRREDYPELVSKLERERRAEEEAVDPRGDMARAKSAWAAARHNTELREWLVEYLDRTSPEPGQKGDGLLGDKAGWRKGAKVAEPLLFAKITKAIPLDDGSLEVHGIASSEDRDDQNEIIRSDAIRSALPDYLKFPAVRLQHRSDTPIGTTLEVDVGQDKITRVVTKIVDRDAITKVRAGVLRGFSLGGAVTQRDPDDPTVITGLRLVELSLCDRPANSSAKVTLWKADMPEPVPRWACGDAEHMHGDKVAAAKCRVEREKGALMTEFEKFAAAYQQRQPLPHLMQKAASSPVSHARTAQELAKRWPGVPTDELGKFVASYGLTRQQPSMGDGALIRFLRHGRV
jgi:hypothetical protein